MDDDQPASQSLGSRAARVQRTGIAEGELVLPAAGSEAEAEGFVQDDEPALDYRFPIEIEVVSEPVGLTEEIERAQETVHYHFPVEVEVRSALETVDQEEVVQETLRRLTQSLDGM